MTASSQAAARQRIAIVGAGIGGLTLAIELRRRGFDPQVYDQTVELREVGAAVALSANATRFLRDRIGIGVGLVEGSASVDGLVFRDGRDGRVISRVMSSQAYLDRCGAPYLGVHRATLQQLLSGALGTEGLHLGKRLMDIDDSGSSAVLHFADGDRVEADLVIGADGVKSLLRRHVVGYDDAQFSGCFGWRGIIAPEQLDLLPDPETMQFWIGPGGHLLHYAIGNGDQNFLLVKRHYGPWTEKAWVAPSTPGEHIAAFHDWHPAVVQMISAAPAAERWGLFHRPPLHEWSKGRVTLIGDAAHAVVPHHGQGANQSIEDAIVLADLLVEALEHGESWDAARERFQSLRTARTRRVQVASITTADVLHLPDGPLAEARNARFRAPDFFDRHLAWIHEFVADGAGAEQADRGPLVQA
jgi:salicylate hydroxylase